ncbi:glycerol kinase GlpK [Aequoribacter sp.]|uniref:glycerol kinase GlpK n=1 Tax=Aequoribacter sp. TaxID=2847771 RepID=UPI003F697E0E
MSGRSAILAIDQGTTSSRAMIFDSDTEIVALAQREFAQHYPNDGWVEHDPEEIWQTTLEVSREVVQQRQDLSIAALGITNQRETTVVWDRQTGAAIYPAIVWQDRRTADVCARLSASGRGEIVHDKTGLLLDPYFSATKIAWILDHVDGARERAERGELAFGTIDSFLIWRLTDGKVHATDATNASRTSLYNIHTGEWDSELLDIFNVPAAVLPSVKNCDDDYGTTAPGILPIELPIRGVAGDQQAAAIGQCCFSAGDIKSTYGTGCFVLLNTGTEAIRSDNKLLTTVAFQLDGQRSYALEGSIFVAGAAVQWLRDGLKLIDSAPQSEALAQSLASNEGVYLVPAFTGLGVPYWRPDVRGAVFGLTRATTPAHFARATLESIAYMTHDLFAAMARDGIEPKSLRVDGGMVANNWLCQFLSDVLAIEVIRPRVLETTALGAAYLAGRSTGVFGDRDNFAALWHSQRQFFPAMEELARSKLLEGWHSAVSKLVD